MVRPIKAAKNRAIADRMLQNQQNRRVTPQGANSAQQASDAIDEYYQEKAAARERNRAWLEEGWGDQTDSDVAAREWVQRQISGARGTSLSQEDIDRALRMARRDDPRPRR